MVQAINAEGVIRYPGRDRRILTWAKYLPKDEFSEYARRDWGAHRNLPAHVLSIGYERR